MLNRVQQHLSTFLGRANDCGPGKEFLVSAIVGIRFGIVAGPAHRAVGNRTLGLRVFEVVEMIIDFEWLSRLDTLVNAELSGELEEHTGIF